MATSVDNCGTCNLRHVSQLSVVWCTDCDEGFCHDCEERHRLLKATRNHNILPIDEYQKLPSFIANIKLYCDQHDEKYQLFCREHNEVLCRKCAISEKHAECKEIFPVEDMIQNAKTSAAFTELESLFLELGENVTLILEDRRNNLSSIAATKKKIDSEISAIRQQINQHLDEIQHLFMNELNKAVENSTKQIQSFIAFLKENKRSIDEFIEDVENIKKHATDMQIFLGINQLETKLIETEKVLQSWIDGNSLAHIVVSYQVNNCLQNISNEITTFGKHVLDVQPCKLSLKRGKVGQAQLMKVNVEPKSSLGRITLKLKTKINTTALNVSGCCNLPCGKFVVSNYDPSYLILFSPDGEIDKKITDIMPKIIDVACVDNETVAIVSYTKTDINLVSLKSGTTIKTIKSSSPSLGITYTEGNLIVFYENGQMQEARLEDNNTNDIGGSVVSRYVTSLGNKLYSVKRYTNTIVCHKRNGDILWTFTDEVLKRPRGITVDEHGNAIVAGVGSNNVIAISSDGTTHKILLSETDFCDSPWVVSYNNKFKYLLVSNEKGGQAFVYSVNCK